MTTNNQTTSSFSDFIDENQQLKYFHVLACCYVGIMITSLTMSARLIPATIPFFETNILITAGTWTIPLSFFIQDITTEVYGYAKSRQLIQLTMLILIFYILYTQLITLLPAPQHTDNIVHEYNTVFTALPRHLFALLCSIFLSNIINNVLIAKMKIWFNGKYISYRLMIATAVGEACLQLVGTSVAWFGSLNFSSEIIPFVVFSYSYKLLFQSASLPIIILICNYLKEKENLDVFDIDTKFNPFKLSAQ